MHHYQLIYSGDFWRLLAPGHEETILVEAPTRKIAEEDADEWFRAQHAEGLVKIHREDGSVQELTFPRDEGPQ